MGIKGLNQIIADNAPAAIVKGEIKQFFGRKVAIDASMSLYQFLIAVRQGGQQLTSESGETTSHLVGLFNRTIRMVDNGIKPLYIFDGRPPKLKSGELAKRGERKEEALKSAAEAKEAGKMEEWERFERRTVRVTREQNDEAKKLLELMGIPHLVAPCEAEAQCAELARSGKVYAAASEDMDTLCFAAPVLLRHLTFSEQRKLPITEYNLEKALEGLELDMARFVDLCILLGCDYVEPIRGIGPVSALKLIKTYHDLDGVVQHFKDNPDGKIKIPDNWAYKDARELFLKPSITDASNIDFKWDQPNVEGLIEFLVKEKGFSEDRVRSAAERLSKALAVKPQGRLEGFFKVKPKDSEPPAKRKKDTKKENVKAGKNKKVKAK